MGWKYFLCLILNFVSLFLLYSPESAHSLILDFLPGPTFIKFWKKNSRKKIKICPQCLDIMMNWNSDTSKNEQLSSQWCRNRGGQGGHWPPQYFADQLTLFEPGRAEYPHLLLLAPQCFSPSGITALSFLLNQTE